MKFTVTRDMFHNALKKAVSCVSKRDSVPILKNFLIQTQDVDGQKEMRIIGSDSSIGVLVVNKVFEPEREGKVAIPADKLYDIVIEVDSKVGKDIEKITVDCKEGFCDINSSKTHWKIKCDKADNYPDVPRYDFAAEVEIKAPQFLNALRKLSKALPDSSDKVKLMMAHFQNGWGFATDSHRIQAVRFEGIDGIDISSTAVPDLIQLLETNVPQVVGIVQTDNFILFRIKNDIYHCSKVSESFPDVARVLTESESYADLFRSSKAELISAVKRVRIASDADSRKIMLFASVDGLKMQSKDVRGDLCEETVSVDFLSQTSRELVVNWKHLLDLLESIDNDEVVFKIGFDKGEIKSSIRVEEPDAICLIQQFRG